MLQISRIIQDKNIDVINAHHYMPFFYSYLGSKILHKRKLIYTEHSVPEVEGISSGKHRHICKMLLHKTDAVIGVSGEIADAFRKGFPTHSGKIVTVPNGVDVERFAIDIDRDRVRAEWGILPEHFVIGMVANFRKVKNHACLIRASNRLIVTYPNIRLLLVGRGYPEDRENSEEEIKQLIHCYKLENRIILTGYREDIPSLLKSFDTFCLPSFSEGLPVSILEAMAARVPVVGSNVRGIREVISPEETGLMFPSDDDNALQQVLERLIKNKNLRNDLSKNACIFVSQMHGIKQWVSVYERLFVK
jgi:glycosyltransferase involved in cell wall biosynthesis